MKFKTNLMASKNSLLGKEVWLPIKIHLLSNNSKTIKGTLMNKEVKETRPKLSEIWIFLNLLIKSKLFL